MNRTLPTYEIAGVPFLVDVDYNLLRHPDKEQIAYRFYMDMEDMGSHYRLLVDAATLQPLQTQQAREKEGVLTIDLPPMVRLDPEGVAEKFRCPVKALPEKDRDLQNNEDLMMRREMGKPAAIMIGEDYFFADTANGYLIGPGLPATDWLNVNMMPLDYFQVCYRCLYDPAARRQYKPGPDEIIPEGILALEIPHLAFADSYNYRRLYRAQGAAAEFSDREWFLRYPVRANMKARFVPVEKLGYQQQASQQAAASPRESIRGPDEKEQDKRQAHREKGRRKGSGPKP